MNIHETVESGKPLTYLALRGDTHEPLLINNQSKLVITPEKTKGSNTELEITTPTGIAPCLLQIMLLLSA